MGEDPDAIRQQIEQTRERMGETVEALGYKADVPARTREGVQDKVQSVKAKVTGAAPDPEQGKQQARRAVGVAQENPLGLAVGAAAVGFLAGMLVPSTQMEHEKLGPAADQVKGQIKDTAQEAMQHGKEIAQESVQAAKDTAQEQGQERAEDLRSTAQDNAQQAVQDARQQV